MCLEMPAQPSGDLVLYPSDFNMSSGPYSNGNVALSVKVRPKEETSVRISASILSEKMFVTVSVLRPLNVEDPNRYWRRASESCVQFLKLYDNSQSG